MAASINAYVKGNRVKVTATVEQLPAGTPLTPTNYYLYVKNMADGTTLTFSHVGGVDSLPAGVSAAIDVADTGIVEFSFDVPTHGTRKIHFKGTGNITVAGESSFVVDKSDVI